MTLIILITFILYDSTRLPSQGSDYSCLKSGNSDNSFRINVITSHFVDVEYLARQFEEA